MHGSKFFNFDYINNFNKIYLKDLIKILDQKLIFNFFYNIVI